MECLQQEDLTEMAQSFLKGFDERVASIPKELCAPFFNEAGRLEVELLAHYRLVVQLARRAGTDNLGQVAALWGEMVDACDKTCRRIESLNELHPDCGAMVFHDSVLDLRNKCRRLQTLHG